ncbi:hypothetical protein BZG72_03925 [Salinivibrio sp. PR6]|nr:hypothetical protein BZG72_03925 [Salinivibrio sp. PR6]
MNIVNRERRVPISHLSRLMRSTHTLFASRIALFFMHFDAVSDDTFVSRAVNEMLRQTLLHNAVLNNCSGKRCSQ